MKRILSASVVLCVALATSVPTSATETENHNLPVLPVPGKVVVDGKSDDWDLSGGLFVCGDVERLRDQFSVWVHAMYDGEAIYVLARWQDPTPLNNLGSGSGDYGFNGDCLQLRFILGHHTPAETITWWTCRARSQWQRHCRPRLPGARRTPTASDQRAGESAQQAFQVNSDGKGYVQELRIPWSLLSTEGKPSKAGEALRMTVEPNFSASQYGRITIKDIFSDSVAKPDRIFTFMNFDQWGTATLQPKGKIETAPVRLADGRTFAATLRDGMPIVDWTGVVKKFEWPGFKSIHFTMPADGFVSLNLVDQQGVVVRQLLTTDFRSAGEQSVAWDGLTTPIHRNPGEPVPAGAYRWQAITHPAFNLRFRGWACDGASAPWESGPTSTWGGDHGTPSACVTDGQRMFLAWNGAEGGRHLLRTDLEGNVQWGLRNTTGTGDPDVIAVDDGQLFILHKFWDDVPPIISRVSAEEGSYVNWKGRDSAVLRIADVWKKDADMPDHFDGLDARNGKLYATCNDAAFRPSDILDWKRRLPGFKRTAPWRVAFGRRSSRPRPIGWLIFSPARPHKPKPFAPGPADRSSTVKCCAC